jgi:predicted nucleic acid-binding protein
MMFWDSSAILPLCVDESYSEQMKSYLMKDPHMAVWWAAFLECVSAFARLQREGLFSDEEMRNTKTPLDVLSQSWTEIMPSRELRDQAVILISLHPLKSADSLQLASARIWAEYKTSKYSFVCLDRTLRKAAQKEGFQVLPEGPLENNISGS